MLSKKFWGGVAAIATVIGLFLSNEVFKATVGSNNSEGNTNIAGNGNITIFLNDFKGGLTSQLSSESKQKQDLADQINTIINKILEASGETNPKEKNATAMKLGKDLGTVIQNAPISKYQLISTEFTLARGVAHFLPGSQTTLAYTNRVTSGPPIPGIFIKVNGKSIIMRSGDQYKIDDDNSECTLILHQINEDFKEATFSYKCG